MKKMMTALLAVSALAAAVPAAAQDWGRHGSYGSSYSSDLRQRYERIEMRIDRGFRSGDLTRWEAGSLSNELSGLRRLDRQYRYTGGGLSRWEREDLDRRTDRLEGRVRYERHDREDRGRRW